ncbi:MAG: tetratricopeptide repeat protein, partial [Dokdonella sp.]
RGGWRYRATRFLRRHALAFGFASAAVLALLIGLATAVHQGQQALLQRDIARTESAKATQTQQFLLDIFRSADPALTQGRKVTAEELLARGTERIATQRFEDAGVHFDLLMAMGEAWLGVGASREALGVFEQALHVQQTQLSTDVPKRVRALTLLARSRGNTDDSAGAARLLDEAATLLPAAAAETEISADLAVTRGINRMSLGDITGAIEQMAHGVALYSRLLGVADDRTTSAAITLSWAYDDQDRHAEARALLEPIVAALGSAPDTNPVRLADALDALANTYTGASEALDAARMRQQALDITRRVYGDTHGYVEIRLNNLSFSLLRAHDYAGANTAMKQALALRSAIEPAGSRKIGTSLNNLASTEFSLGNWSEAERLWTQALVIRRNGTDITDVAFSLSGSAAAAREQGKLADARERIDEALGILRAHPLPKPTHLARVLIERTEVDLAFGIVDCAGAEEAVGLMVANSANDDPQRLYAEVVAAACALRISPSAQNTARVIAAQAALRAQFPPDSARVGQAQRYALVQ